MLGALIGAQVMDFSIRSARARDREALCKLFEELDELHRLERPDIFRKPYGARREASWLDQIMAGPDSVILVAEREERALLGLAVLIEKATPAAAT